MSDVLVYVQRGGDTVVWNVFKVFRTRLAVDGVDAGNGNGFISSRNVPEGRKTEFKKLISTCTNEERITDQKNEERMM